MTRAADLPDDCRQCRRCGSTHLAVQVIAWADYRNGEFQCLDITEYSEPKPRGYAMCHDCNHQQPIRG
jgi:hypothetical protein